MITSLLVGAVVLQVKATTVVVPEPVRLAKEVQRTIDRDGGQALERAWRDRLAKSPESPAALFAVATFERSRYRYERADSLYRRLAARADLEPAWRAMAQVGMAVWRALGSDPARADSLYSAALVIARERKEPAVEAEIFLGLSQLRGRTQGPRAGLALLTDWWSALPTKTAEDSAQRLCLTGALDEQLGDTTGGRRIIRGAEAAERSRAWRTAGTCRLAMAQTAERRGYLNAATGSARQSLDHFARIRYELGSALASQWLGYAMLQANRFASARIMLERAIVSARATRFASVEAWAQSGLADLHLTLGDPAQARVYAELAAASHRARGDGWGLAVARSFEGDALAAAGDLPEASARYAASHAAYVAAGISRNAVPALVARARMQLRLGQLDSAEQTIAVAGALGRTTEGWIRDGAILRAGLSLRRGQLAKADSFLHIDALSRSVLSGTNGLGGVSIALFRAQVALRRDRIADAESSLVLVTRSLADWRAAPKNRGLTASLAQLRTNWGGLSDVAPDLVAQLAERQRIDLAFTFVEQLRAREIVERSLRAVAQLSDSSAASLALRVTNGEATLVTLPELQRTLGRDEAFVSYTLGVDDAPTSAIIVTREAVTARALPTGAVLRPDITRFAQLAAIGTEPIASSRRLGAALLAPVLAALPATVTRLTLSPDGDLHRVPFDALRLPDGRYAVERATISLAPSATALLALRVRASTEGRRIVAFGDPRYPRPRPIDAMHDDGARMASPLRTISLDRLRHSGEEARRVARYGVRSSVWVASGATEDTFRSTDWRDVAVLHVAAHAIVNAESQSGTALALAPGRETDGFLTPTEITQLPLRGPLVVLSACGSLGGQVLGGEGLRGLTAPLLEAGARAVVATYWSIGDRSTVPFVDRFYAAMATGARVDEALRQTKLAAIRDGASIADWGSFSVIGDGALRVPLRASSLAPTMWLRDVSQPRRDSGGPP